MNETSKAVARRRNPNIHQYWDWKEIFKGKGVDIGSGDDPLKWPGVEVIPFDKEQGDANHIDTYFEPNSLDFVHGSQVLEHLHNPIDALHRMLALVKPGGNVIITVPDYDLYEKGTFPSRFNGDHKSTWSLTRKAVPLARDGKRYPHVYVPELRKIFPDVVVEAQLITTNYDFMTPDVDQTFEAKDAVECFIEVLIHKPA